MWKESYRLGVDKIDLQHIELFNMTANLMEAIQQPDTQERKKECKEAILFLKNYALEHFEDEEEYQKSIQYDGFEEHRQLHLDFVSNVLKHEEKMISSDFDMKDIENFIGMLVAWLVYHVADADQKIVAKEEPERVIIDCFCTAVCYAFNRMAHLNKNDINRTESPDGFEGDVSISVKLTGDVPVTVEYVYTNELIFKLLKAFLFIRPKSIDSLVCSVLLEITNSINKNAVNELAKENISVSLEQPIIKLSPPFSSLSDFSILDTSIGKLKIGICALSADY